jgi:hypothetical protein
VTSKRYEGPKSKGQIYEVLQKSPLLMTSWILYTEEGGCQPKPLVGTIFIHRSLGLYMMLISTWAGPFPQQ